MTDSKVYCGFLNKVNQKLRSSKEESFNFISYFSIQARSCGYSTSAMVRVLNAILGFQTAPKPLASGPEIWYEVFIWCLFSSIGIYVCAALVAFLTLRKHKFGRFYSLMILLMGFFLPLTLGVVSSASIAFVYKTSRFVFAVACT